MGKPGGFPISPPIDLVADNTCPGIRDEIREIVK